jgi:hypothetical protein
LRNAIWIAGSLFVAWAIVGGPSVSHMEQAWTTVTTAMQPPETVAQIAEPGAVIAARDVPFVVARIVNTGRGRHMKSKLEQYGGTFRAGQHICAGIATWGYDGKLSVTLSNGDMADASNAPGNFRPDTSANGCERIPDIRELPNRNGSVIKARKQLAEIIAVQPATIAGNGFAAFYALVLCFAFWARAQHYRHKTPIDRATLRQRFTGFAAHQSDFEEGWGGIYRVNSDGFRVNLEDWQFDGGSGEFFRIEKRFGNRTVVETTPFNQRFVLQAKDMWWKIKTGIKAAAAAVISTFGWTLALHRYGDPEKFNIYALGAAAVSLYAIVLTVGLISNWHLKKIGPEPLSRAVGEFGTQQPHGSRDDEGTI